MLHQMNLHPAPFSLVESGLKTIELRLYDEKRRQIAVGDTILFTCTDDPARTEDMNLYYTAEQQACYGVVGIEISPCTI